jgi:hypothetical protein
VHAYRMHVIARGGVTAHAHDYAAISLAGSGRSFTVSRVIGVSASVDHFSSSEKFEKDAGFARAINLNPCVKQFLYRSSFDSFINCKWSTGLIIILLVKIVKL